MTTYKGRWQGRRKSYSVNVRCDDGHTFCLDVELPEDQAAYLNRHAKVMEPVHGELFNEVLYSVPVWAAGLGLMEVWMVVSDLFYMRNPWR